MISHKKILLLIDLQLEFDAAHDQDLVKIINIEIAKAKKENIPIVNLIYVDNGDVVKPIRKNLDGYSNLVTIQKRKNDGGRLVHELFENMVENSPIGEIYVCGVNTEICVKETLLSLYDYNENYKIFLISNGCSSENENDHFEQIEDFLSDKKINIIYTEKIYPHNYVTVDEKFTNNHMNAFV